MATWERKRTAETRRIEDLFRDNHFPRTDAYRFNSASIRVRVIDPQFAGKSIPEREELLSSVLEQIPEETRSDILFLLTLAPEEVGSFNRHALMNLEFEDPPRSRV